MGKAGKREFYRQGREEAAHLFSFFLAKDC